MAKQTFTTGQVLTAAQMTSLQQTAMLGGDTTAKTVSYTLLAADAGTTVAMSNAGSTTITVNTSLFTAGDIVTIQNRGAGVCTVTAGTATVNTSGSLVLAQYQGGVLYFTSTSAAIFFQFATPASGDIEGVTAGTGLTGGGTSGTVTLSINTAVTADLTTAQTLTNKKLSDSTTTIVDVTDATKAVKFDVNGTTAITGTIATNFTTAKTITIPDATDTLVGRATTDTLTNKTLTTPVIASISNTGTITVPTTTGTLALTSGVINNTLTSTTGDTIYASSANTPARLAVGSAGQVLTVAGGVPTWATPAAGGGLTLLSTTNITAVTQISITGISQSYKNLFIVLNGFRPGSNATNLQTTLETSGAVAVPAQVIENFYNGTAGTLISNSPIQICNDMNSTAVGVNGANFWIYNYASTTLTKGITGQSNVYGVTSGNYRIGNFGGYTYSSTGIGAVSTIKFNPSIGSWTANGTIQIYGEN
jgi:hypothetical protein